MCKNPLYVDYILRNIFYHLSDELIVDKHLIKKCANVCAKWDLFLSVEHKHPYTLFVKCKHEQYAKIYWRSYMNPFDYYNSRLILSVDFDCHIAYIKPIIISLQRNLLDNRKLFITMIYYWNRIVDLLNIKLHDGILDVLHLLAKKDIRMNNIAVRVIEYYDI